MAVHWALPGPAAFMADLLAILREGHSLEVHAPVTVADGIASAVSDELDGAGWSVRSLTPGGRAPLDEVADCLDAVLPVLTERRSVAALLRALERKRTLIIGPVGPQHLAAWQTFAVEYATAARSVHPTERTQLVLVTAGTARSLDRRELSGLKRLRWDAVVGETDLLVHASRTLMHAGAPRGPLLKLHARLVARLALWDLQLADYLLGLPLSDLFMPCETLRLGMRDCPAPAAADWASGGVASFDGETMRHSMLLAAAGDPDGELRMRVWGALASELMPLLELRRRDLAVTVGSALRSKVVRLNDEVVRDFIGLEIGPLAYLARRYGLPPSILNRAEVLREVRNDLAHLRPLTFDQVMSADLMGTGASFR